MFGALKGLNKSAQGNALGTPHDDDRSPERAKQARDVESVPPLQVLRDLFLPFSQGVALGWFVRAFQAQDGDR
jgi:hypothetical protein